MRSIGNSSHSNTVFLILTILLQKFYFQGDELEIVFCAFPDNKLCSWPKISLQL